MMDIQLKDLEIEYKERRKERYDHVYLRMKLFSDGEWHWIKTFDWNEHGFNFFFDHDFEVGKIIEFKKGITKFSGDIVWERQRTDRQTMAEMAINNILFEELEKKDNFSEPALTSKITSMVRSFNKIEEKIYFLNEEFCIQITTKDLEQRISSNQWDKVGHYGIHVKSDSTWITIFQEAFRLSEPLREFVLEKQKKWETLKD